MDDESNKLYPGHLSRPVLVWFFSSSLLVVCGFRATRLIPAFGSRYASGNAK